MHPAALPKTVHAWIPLQAVPQVAKNRALQPQIKYPWWMKPNPLKKLHICTAYCESFIYYWELG